MKTPLNNNLKLFIYALAIIAASVILSEILQAKFSTAKHNDLTPEVKI